MLSRVAASFFWIGRYIERAEYTSRLADVLYHLMLEGAEPGDHVRVWRTYLDNTGELDLYRQTYGDIRTRPVLEFLTLDEQNPNAMLNLIAAARNNARGIQDQLSSEFWHHLNRFYLSLQPVQANDLWRSPHALLVRIRDTCYTLHGVIGSTMLHDEGWSFYRLGKHIERANYTARLLANPILLQAAHEPDDLSEFYQLIAVLKSASAYEAYRKVYRTEPRPVKIVDFLLLNDRFPRSVHFCARSMRTVLARLTDKPDGPIAREPERLIGQLAADLSYARLDEIYGTGLPSYLRDLVGRLERIDAVIAQTYFGIDTSEVTTAPEAATPARIPTALAPVHTERQAVLAIRHAFHYRYDEPVQSVRTLMRLAPNQRYGRQRLLDMRWQMEPPGDYRHYTDAFGNPVWQMDHGQVDTEIACTVEMQVETRASYLSDGMLALQGTDPIETDGIVEPAEFLLPTGLVDRSEGLLRLAQRLRERGSSAIEQVEAIMHQVAAVIRYESGITRVDTKASAALALGAGVCQDMAHVMLALCRMLELPARYVSGYLPGEGQMHAWVEVLLPVGPERREVWVGYDPTHQRRCDERYVTVAVGRDYQDIAPTAGWYTGAADSQLTVTVSVTLEAQGPADQGWARADLAPQTMAGAQQQ